MPVQTAVDNQWWYAQSPLRAQVVDASYVELEINGLRCPMKHSEVGGDGRPTHSFKFLRPSDRELWCELRGQQVVVEFVQAFVNQPDIDIDDDGTVDQVVTKSLPNKFDQTPQPQDSLFDAYIFVDWSAAARARQGKDSIWIAEAWRDIEGRLIGDENIVRNPATRAAAYDHINTRLEYHLEQGHRVLVGFDFPYGYPCGTSQHILPIENGANERSALWQCLADSIEDGPNNASNRFVVANNLNQFEPQAPEPFWGKPAGRQELAALPTGKPQCFQEGRVTEFRHIEQHLRAQGRRPFSVWQLFGNGSVGSQSLTGLPYVHRLRTHPRFDAVSQVWPFETGWLCPGRTSGISVVHAEIWPGAIPVNYELHPVRDAAQMLSYLSWAARFDAAGELGQFFAPLQHHGDEGLADQALQEGWILGFMA